MQNWPGEVFTGKKAPAKILCKSMRAPRIGSFSQESKSSSSPSVQVFALGVYSQFLLWLLFEQLMCCSSRGLCSQPSAITGPNSSVTASCGSSSESLHSITCDGKGCIYPGKRSAGHCRTSLTVDSTTYMRD